MTFDIISRSNDREILGSILAESATREFGEDLGLQLTLGANYLTREQVLVVRRATSEARDASRDKSRIMLRVYK